MGKTLGLDLGTNSLGWAIVESNESGYQLLDKGVDIFQEGVARNQGREVASCSDRTKARAARRHYYRRRLRKIELLKVLIANDFCPALTAEQLDAWRYQKKYPMDDAFLLWQRTDDKTDRNPYRDRYAVLTEKFDLSNRAARHQLGRALYHLSQRRGFLSNRKDQGQDSESGKVKSAIHSLSEEMSRAGCSYLGEYYYKLHQEGQKIREHHAARKEHYEKEFTAICDKQQLPDELVKALHRAIFFQRPLKSQKGTVGTCTFEKGKPRCPISHPRYEEYRMLQMLNNIKIRTSEEEEFRSLTPEEREILKPLFARKSKSHFEFAEIAKKLCGKGCSADFNYKLTTTVSGSPVTAALISLFGTDWIPTLCSVYVKGAGKNEDQILNDVWHALFTFDDDEKLQAWAQTNLQLNNEQAKQFSNIPVSQGYAALSLNAINKILPYLRQGYRLDESIFLANLKSAMPAEMWDDEGKRIEVEQSIVCALNDYAADPTNRGWSKEQRIAEVLSERFGIPMARVQRLYHPSKVEVYCDARPDAEGILQLGSPRIAALRNPMAMRALTRLRALVNYLLREGRIDRYTKINIEMARELNDANRRAALERDNRNRENQSSQYAKAIQEAYMSETGQTITPTDEDILKYRLWEEQKHICLYTGERIGISQFIGPNPMYDIEHTVPRSRGGDNAQMNKTLCQAHYNRSVKREYLPSELVTHADILARIETLGWAKEIERLERQIQAKIRASRSATTKESKDAAIQDRHYLKMQRDYWAGKLMRFTMTEVPSGFSNRQGVDIGIIGRYARMYLETVFERVYPVKGATTAEFRKMWGLQDANEAKSRNNHAHHCIDAITIACIDKAAYEQWARFKRDTENYEWYQKKRPETEKPWPTFTEDIKSIVDELLIAHHTPDNMRKRARKCLRIRGKIQRDEQGRIKYQQGDVARACLHQDTFYGAILRDDGIKYVLRKKLDSLKDRAEAERIVDDAIRRCVLDAIEREGFKEAVSKPICFNAEKGVYIKKVRVFTLPNTRPIALKKHRDISRHEHKRDYYVTITGCNYSMALYEAVGVAGEIKRSVSIKSNLMAAQAFNMKTGLVSQISEEGYPLRYILRKGSMVLLYEKSPEELRTCSKVELAKRLYKVTGLSLKVDKKRYLYGMVTLKHHQEASRELKTKNGQWKVGEAYRPVIEMSHNQINAYVEGWDFDMTVTGEIKFRH